MKDVYILAVESSCDETSVSIIKNGYEDIATIINTQIDVHTKYGGVVPEVASRLHLENITMVINECMEKANMKFEDIDAFACTYAPGLLGSLLVGVEATKALSYIYKKPFIAVNHMMGHIYANMIGNHLEYPLLSLIISGGHTDLILMKSEDSFEYIGQTLDDAIGEAYDKVARILRLPYPGGPKIDKLSKLGQPVYKLPKPKVDSPLDFSFSGLKSAIMQSINRIEKSVEKVDINDMCASFQQTALSALWDRVDYALKNYDVKQFVLAGGVAANSKLREIVQQKMQQDYPTISYIIPPLSCCTDNAAMIGASGYIAYLKGIRSDYSTSAMASIDLEN